MALPCRILILLATYNGQTWLKDQIDSVLNQEGVQVQVLVSDDCSTDHTVEIVTTFTQTDSRVRMVSCDRKFGSAGRNFLSLLTKADLTHTDYVAFCDQDDVWLPNKLSTAVQILNSSGAHGYSCAVRAVWPDGREKVISQVSSQRSSDFIFEGAGQGCTFVMTKEFLLRAQLFIQKNQEDNLNLHYHDWLMYILARAWSMSWHFDTRPWIIYRQHGNNEIGARGSLSSITYRLKKIKNGWYLTQIQSAFDIYKLAGGDNLNTILIGNIINSSKSLKRRFLLIQKLAKHSRRRKSDRLVLVLTAMLGWL